MARNSNICSLQRATGPGSRKLGFATTVGSAEKEGSPEAPAERPNVLGRALSHLALLAKGLASDSGGHRHRLAAPRLQNVLGQDFIAEKCRSTPSQLGSQRFDPKDVGSESLLGSTENPWGAAETRP